MKIELCESGYMREDDAHGRLVVIMDEEDGSFFLIREGLTDDDDEKIDDPGFFVPASDMEAFCRAALTHVERSKTQPRPQPKPEPSAEDIKIYDLGISVRLCNLLRSVFEGYREGWPEIDVRELMLGDICKHSRRDYMKFRNFGKRSLNELHELLLKHNLDFKK